MNRRDFFKQLAAAGTVIAGELWVPGAKLISIPSGRIFTNDPFSIDANGNITINARADQNKVTVLQLHRWLSDLADSDTRGSALLDITDPIPSQRSTDNIIHITDGYYVQNPEYLTEGSITQRGEHWAGIKSIGTINEDTVAYLNNKPAVRPGHVNQCIKVNPVHAKTVNVKTRTPGMMYTEFKIKPVSQGTNYLPIMEQIDRNYI